MAIQISGTTVIDDSKNITNIESYAGPGVATQAEAEAGTNNDQLMTPLRVKQSIEINAVQSVIKRIQRGISSYSNSNTTSVPITTVDTGKSFISSSNAGTTKVANTGNWGPNVAQHLVGSTAEASLSASSVSITGGTGHSIFRPNPQGGPQVYHQSGEVSWEVIEFL